LCYTHCYGNGTQSMGKYSAQTIVNCFRTCGFIKDGQTIGEGIPVQGEKIEVNSN